MSEFDRDLTRSGSVQGDDVMYYAERLQKLADRVDSDAKAVARSLRVTASDMQADHGRRGAIAGRSGLMYKENLQADLAALKALGGLRG